MELEQKEPLLAVCFGAGNRTGAFGIGKKNESKNQLPESQPAVATRVLRSRALLSICGGHKGIGGRRMAGSSVRFDGVHRVWR